MILFIFSCLIHKTNFTGVIDSTSDNKCTIELASGQVILIESKVCESSREGDKIYFYAGKK